MPLGNLRQLANNQTTTINPNVAATLKVSTGFTVNASHRQVPSYDSFAVVAQVQPLSTGDIRHNDALNVQGVMKAVYLNGVAEAINRIKTKGGDLLVFADGVLAEGNTWLITEVTEQWAQTWCRVTITLQDDP
jgi:hypothetical protein